MKTVEETAKLLASEHSDDDADLQRILWAPAEREVRLVEVSSAIKNHRKILPFRFTPDGDEVPYESVIVIMSPEDWKQVQDGDLELPQMFGRPADLTQLFERERAE